MTESSPTIRDVLQDPRQAHGAGLTLNGIGPDANYAVPVPSCRDAERCFETALAVTGDRLQEIAQDPRTIFAVNPGQGEPGSERSAPPQTE